MPRDNHLLMHPSLINVNEGRARDDSRRWGPDRVDINYYHGRRVEPEPSAAELSAECQIAICGSGQAIVRDWNRRASAVLCRV